MLQRLRNRQRGFTLIELLIVIAIIGIIAAILIPNLLDALQKAKQKRSMADIRNVGTAWFAWLTDQAGAAAAGSGGGSDFNMGDFATAVGYTDLVGTLQPTTTFFYMQEIPQFDGWKHPLEFGYTSGGLTAARQMVIRSSGRDGTTSGDTYTSGAFTATDYDQDIVWSDGYFVRWPGGVGTTAAGS